MIGEQERNLIYVPRVFLHLEGNQSVGFSKLQDILLHLAPMN